MKKLLIILILVGMGFGQTEAQTFNEWFRQKKTQKRYLIKQIALLQLYLGYVKKGYEIVNYGLTTIGNIKEGDFNLHRDYFSSLKDVNPQISKSAKIADIVAHQAFILRELKKVNNFCKGNKDFTMAEVRYVNEVYSNMLSITDANITELLTIVRSGESEMKDDERLARIDVIYADSLDQYTFARAFSNETYVLGGEREKEGANLQQTRQQYGII